MREQNELIITIDPAKTALLLIHWQNDCATKGGKIAFDTPDQLAKTHTIENTQAVLKASRKKGVLIIYINAAHRPNYPEISPKAAPFIKGLVAAGALVRGTWGAQVIDQLKPLDDDIIINNYSASCFYSTELDIILRNKGITDLVLTGLHTNWAVESTARDGINRGYFIYSLKDCCKGINDEMHEWAFKNILSQGGVVLDSKAFIESVQNSNTKL